MVVVVVSDEGPALRAVVVCRMTLLRLECRIVLVRTE